MSYARIRSIDSDAARTGRQRIVIGRILERAKDADASQLMDTAANTLKLYDFIYGTATP